MAFLSLELESDFPPRDDLRDMVDDGGGRPVSDCLLFNLALVVIGDAPSLFALVVILAGVAWAECGVFLLSEP